MARDLHLQEAALTGESLPIEKGASANSQSGGTNRVFLGTSVVSGTATMLVTATGPATVFGDIAKRLVARPEPTEFERELRQFGQLILRSVVFLLSCSCSSYPQRFVANRSSPCCLPWHWLLDSHLSSCP